MTSLPGRRATVFPSILGKGGSMKQPVMRVIAGVAALAAIAFGASAIAGANKSSTGGRAGFAAARGGMPPGGAPPQGMHGGPPPGAPGMGTPVTGEAASKARAAALARYPGTVERVEATPDGHYVVHVIRSNGSEVHVLLDKQFKVVGTFGGPPHGRVGPGGTPPTRSKPPAAGSSNS